MTPSKKSSPSDPMARVQEAREEAALAMRQVAGNTSACTMGREGRSFPAYKYYEGKSAALGALARRLKTAPDEDRGAVVHALIEEWRQEAAARASHSKDWQAYTAGGLDAAIVAEEWIG